MLASEMINELQNMIALHGDWYVAVCLGFDDASNIDITEICIDNEATRFIIPDTFSPYFMARKGANK